jgi:hypothetical protein
MRKQPQETIATCMAAAQELDAARWRHMSQHLMPVASMVPPGSRVTAAFSCLAGPMDEKPTPACQK